MPKLLGVPCGARNAARGYGCRTRRTAFRRILRILPTISRREVWPGLRRSTPVRTCCRLFCPERQPKSLHGPVVADHTEIDLMPMSSNVVSELQQRQHAPDFETHRPAAAGSNDRFGWRPGSGADDIGIRSRPTRRDGAGTRPCGFQRSPYAHERSLPARLDEAGIHPASTSGPALVRPAYFTRSRRRDGWPLGREWTSCPMLPRPSWSFEGDPPDTARCFGRRTP